SVKNTRLKENFQLARGVGEKLQIMNEMALIFPQEEVLPAWIQSLAAANKGKSWRKRRIYLLVLLFLAVAGTWRLWRAQRPNAESEVPVAKPVEANSVAPTFPQTHVESARGSISPAVPPIQRYGYLQLELPDEVESWVDDRWVAETERKKYRVAAGPH